MVTMHFNSCPAYDMGSIYNEWFSTRLGYPVKLLYIGDYRRKVLGNMGEGVKVKDSSWLNNSAAAVPMVASVGYGLFQASSLCTTKSFLTASMFIVSSVILLAYFRYFKSRSKLTITFADLAAYLIITTTSFDNVNERLPENDEMDITKFRPNIVVAGAKKPFEEDFWAELQIGENIEMKLTQNCARCSSLNVDYATGKPGKTDSGQVLKILSKDRRVDPGMKWSPIFGKYGFISSRLIDTYSLNIRVGDDVIIKKRNSERTVTGKPFMPFHFRYPSYCDGKY
jgi:uncharacterized protein YcbX